MIADKKIRTVRIGNRQLVRVDEFRRFLDERDVG
jgi:hypothetical protein